MAGASAKKSNAARKAADEFYRPFLVMVNLVYVLLRGIRVGLQGSWGGWVGLVTLWVLQIVAYYIILDDAARRATASSTTTASSKGRTAALAGGAALDLLGLVLFIQFAALLWTPRVYYLLWILPVWGIYLLYRNFFGGTSSPWSALFSGAASGAVDDDELSSSPWGQKKPGNQGPGSKSTNRNRSTPKRK